jgi:hypothetical protein
MFPLANYLSSESSQIHRDSAGAACIFMHRQRDRCDTCPIIIRWHQSFKLQVIIGCYWKKLLLDFLNLD